MTLLSIVREAAVALGLPEPSAVASSNDLAVKKLLVFANQAGRQLARYHDWQNLIVEQQFTTLAQQEQTNALPPADYDRLVYNPEIWDRSSNLRLFGPVPQRYWQRALAGIATGTPGYWRIIGNQLNVLPVMAAGHNLAFEYISKRWAQSAGGTRQDSFMADTDTALVPEHLIALEIIWRFRQSRGFAQYAEDMSTAEREKEKAAAADRGTGRIRTESTYYNDQPQPPYFTGIVGS
ncbi:MULTISPECIES: hypothetical protein [Rhodomicrobium]|uniref:hypothetical protein n=1 Tax=Rhodomicrobium TaxID=1068 RepID=UPI000F74AC4C|nr:MULTISPECIES: hypothetical protein [Rhodomicrobium]